MKGFAAIPEARRFLLANATIPAALLDSDATDSAADGLITTDVTIADGKVEAIGASRGKAGLPRLDLSVDVLRRAAPYALDFVLTSDAHHVPELDRVRFAALNAERAWIDPERVVNTWSAERLAAWATRKRACGGACA